MVHVDMLLCVSQIQPVESEYELVDLRDPIFVDTKKPSKTDLSPTPAAKPRIPRKASSRACPAAIFVSWEASRVTDLDQVWCGVVHWCPGGRLEFLSVP